MTAQRAEIGLSFHRSFPPALVADFARRLDAGGADEIWIIEDSFFTAGASLAATALAVTERLRVGIGILPVVSRNPAVTAMEVATLCELAPGRVMPGLGHGVQSWMAQMGVKAASPLTAFEEVMDSVRRLLAGETVSTQGQYVKLDEVKLDRPPRQLPKLLAGVSGPKSLALAGRVAGGLVLAEPASPTYVRQSLDHAGHPDDFEVAVFSSMCVAPTRDQAYKVMTPWLAWQLGDPSPVVRALPFFDDLAQLFADRGADGLAGIPVDWWSEIGPIGTMDDALAHIEALEQAGVNHIGLWPAADPAKARDEIPTVTALAKR
jgi:alkanesulfonate monooxygenase SsuD/methylene tetrahydromethanopterin reductase-like flavin-dependent oxidoreductase (luciferase family)